MHQSPRKLIKHFFSFIDPSVEHDLLSPTKPWALSPLICTMPHFMHTRVPVADFGNTAMTKQVERSCYLPILPPFPPTQSIRDSTDDLYLTVIQEPDSSSSTSNSSRGSSSSGIKKVFKKTVKRRGLNVEHAYDVPRFESAGQRRSYFNSASRRELIQFGPEVCAVSHRIEYVLTPMKYVGRDNDRFLLWIF